MAAGIAPSSKGNVLYWAALYARYSEPSTALSIATELTALGRSLGDDVLVARGLSALAFVQTWRQPDDALEDC